MLVEQKIIHLNGQSIIVFAIAGKHFSIAIEPGKLLYRLVWKNYGAVASLFVVAECLVGLFIELESIFCSQDSVDIDLFFDILVRWQAIESKHPEYISLENMDAK